MTQTPQREFPALGELSCRGSRGWCAAWRCGARGLGPQSAPRAGPSYSVCDLEVMCSCWAALLSPAPRSLAGRALVAVSHMVGGREAPPMGTLLPKSQPLGALLARSCRCGLARHKPEDRRGLGSHRMGGRQGKSPRPVCPTAQAPGPQDGRAASWPARARRPPHWSHWAPGDLRPLLCLTLW